jgi:DNA adenine methylase
MIKSPISWYGGKFFMRKHLYPLFDIPHITFVDVFGGAGNIIIGKPPSKVDVYNDLHSGVVNLFRVLRDKDTSRKLFALLQLTPHSREEFYYCRDNWQSEEDVVEKARQFFVVCKTSHAGNQHTWQFSKKLSRCNMGAINSKLINTIDDLLEVGDRLRQIQIENSDFEKVIDLYDGKETLFYCDPPYVSSSRKVDDVYLHEMSNADHIRFLNRVTNIEGMAVISGYDTELYNSYLSDWVKKNFSHVSRSSGHGEKDRNRTEVVWLSPNHPLAQE